MIDGALLAQFKKYKVIPVIVVESVDDALRLGEILMEEDLPIAEITFRSLAAAKALGALKKRYPVLCVCAGTVLNEAQVSAAADAGADFIVSPGFNPKTVAAAKAMNIPIIPGINNPTTIEQALAEGLTVLKFFPAEASGGINMIKSLLAPYQDIMLMPTGGISPDNVRAYLNIERVIACGLSWMVDPKLIKDGQWLEIRERIRTIKTIVRGLPS